MNEGTYPVRCYDEAEATAFVNNTRCRVFEYNHIVYLQALRGKGSTRAIYMLVNPQDHAPRAVEVTSAVRKHELSTKAPGALRLAQARMSARRESELDDDSLD